MPAKSSYGAALLSAPPNDSLPWLPSAPGLKAKLPHDVGGPSYGSWVPPAQAALSLPALLVSLRRSPGLPSPSAA